MKVKMGPMADGYAWMVHNDEGTKVYDKGWDADYKTAKQQMNDAVFHWQSQDYEYED